MTAPIHTSEDDAGLSNGSTSVGDIPSPADPRSDVEDLPSAPARSFVSNVAHRFAKDRVAMVAAIILALLVLTALCAPLIAPYDPNEVDPVNSFQPPSAHHLFGTDDIGRDYLSRMIYGARLSLGSALIAVMLGFAIGVVPGLVAGYRRGLLDMIASRIVDAMMCIPGLILAITLVAVLGPGIYQLSVAVGIAFAPRFYRVARGAALSVGAETYIKSAHAAGARSSRILVRHVVPNALPPIIVQGSLMFGFGVLAEAGLSFLGMGAQPPSASWGSMLQRGTRFLLQAQYLTIIPGLMIMSTILAANTVGDGLQSVLGVRRTKEQPK